jgi:hypothetical protein
MYIEQVLGFRKIDAFENCVYWEMPDGCKGQIGIRNLRFGNIVTDIVAEGDICEVNSNGPYMLYIKETAYQIQPGENRFQI